MKSTIIAVIISGAVILSVFIMTNQQGATQSTMVTAPAQNVTTEAGKQIVAIDTKGGYSPRLSTAKAGVPTTLRMVTNGTFDCSSSVRIPSLAIQKTLPATGATDIDIPPQTAGTKLKGLCIMGMYNFEIAFE